MLFRFVLRRGTRAGPQGAACRTRGTQRPTRRVMAARG
ncbi:hypothetical protein EMIT0158MI4_20442 [Burkholderia ambifaria]